MQITKEQADMIIETREPRGVFYCVDDSVYIGIDNRRGDAFVEEFDSEEACLDWLS